MDGIDFVETLSGNEDIINNASNDEITDVDLIASLKDDDKTNILTAVKGKSYDLDGNILNDKNEIILSVADFRKSLAEQIAAKNTPITNVDDIEAIVIDEVNYSINENGEAVNDKGEVIKTREEVEAILAEQSGNDDDVTDLGAVIEKVSKLTGYETVDADGNPVEFDNSIEGMAKREEYIVNTYGQNIAINALNSIFDAKPELRELYEYIELNGSADGFSFGEKPLNVELTDKNTDVHRSLIIKGQMMKGNSQAIAETIADAFIDDGKSLEAAKTELEFINGRINNQVAARRQALAVKEDAKRQEQLKTFNAIRGIVSSGKIGDVTIPSIIKTRDKSGNVVQRNREDFLKYYAVPVADGKTQYEIEATSRTNEEKLLDAYLLFTGNDKNSLIDRAATTKHIKFIRKAKAGTNGSQQQQRSGGGSKIDVNSIVI